jgi:TonB-dependent SusC/RagA subfamily outer membrane receptor
MTSFALAAVSLLALVAPIISTASAQVRATAAIERLGTPAIEETRHDAGGASTQLKHVTVSGVQPLPLSSGGAVIRIHCASTIGSGAHAPVYVIDGVVMGLKANGTVDDSLAARTMIDLAPENIASIEVLKGPRGIELYGEGAHNGVILITTKRKARGR